MSSNLSLSGQYPPCHGPLESHLEGFGTWLSSRGYKPNTRRLKKRLCIHLNHWLEEQNIPLLGLNECQIAAWLGSFSKPPISASVTGRQLLEWLRTNGHLAPAQDVREADWSPVERIERRYQSFLHNDRGLSAITIKNYLPVVHRFLCERFPAHTVELETLTLNDVNHFLRGYHEKLSPGRVKVLVSALRSFLGYLFQRGEITTDIASAIPGVPNWRLAGLPKPFEPDQVKAIVNSCDLKTNIGIRDHAILLLLAQMGLRACEVVHLTLDDIDWNRGIMTISGKNNCRDPLPLPHEVGEAMVTWLQNGRPRSCTTRRLFVSIKAPHSGFASSTVVGDIVRRALARTGITPSGMGAAHRLRHSLATRMLGHGASLAEIGQVLRHNHPDSTRIYAKVDIDALRSLAPAWPVTTS